jgi:hypothetical protein
MLGERKLSKTLEKQYIRDRSHRLRFGGVVSALRKHFD